MGRRRSVGFIFCWVESRRKSRQKEEGHQRDLSRSETEAAVFQGCQVELRGQVEFSFFFLLFGCYGKGVFVRGAQ